MEGKGHEACWWGRGTMSAVHSKWASLDVSEALLLGWTRAFRGSGFGNSTAAPRPNLANLSKPGVLAC